MAEAKNQDCSQSDSDNSGNKSTEETDECNPNQLVNRKVCLESDIYRSSVTDDQ